MGQELKKTQSSVNWMIKGLVVLLLIGAGFFIYTNYIAYDSRNTAQEGSEAKAGEQEYSHLGLAADTSVASVSLTDVLSGGPGKDGIPAINSPSFVSIEVARVDDDTLGILVSVDGEKRYYPYNILVWHEVVNDSIGDTDFAVTFCPLCGSAIVFDRKVQGETLTFGVSGLLFESNLLMYDTKTESLWSQARGEAVVGALTDTKLSLLDMRLLDFNSLKETHPDAVVLSQNTGHIRNYNTDPYTGYGLSEDLYFPVSVSDKRFFAKELFYIVPFKEHSLALQDSTFDTSSEIEIDGVTLVAERLEDGIGVITEDGKSLPGYYEMWFSWATHHQEDGVVWEVE